MKYIAFLRAINVAGKNLIKMQALQELFTGAGYKNSVTYLQSGNVVFETAKAAGEKLETSIEKLISDKLKLTISSIVLSETEIENIISENPFTREKPEIDKLHITIMKTKIEKPDAGTIDSKKDKNEKYLIKDNSIYLYCPDGYGKTKLNNSNLEKWLQNTGTTRNWKTILAVKDLMKS